MSGQDFVPDASVSAHAKDAAPTAVRLIASVTDLVKGFRQNRAQLLEQAAKYPNVPMNNGKPEIPLLALFPDLGYIPPQDFRPWTPGEKTPVMFIHGTIGAPGNFEKFVPEIKDRRLFFAAYGLNGTRPLAECVAEVTSQILELVEKIQAPELILVGHSRGGLVALLAASDPRVSKIVHIQRIIGIGANFSGAPRWKILPKDDDVASASDELFDGDFRNLVNKDYYRAAFFKASKQLFYRAAGSASQDQFFDSPMLVEMLKHVNKELHVVSIASDQDAVVPKLAAWRVPTDHVERVLVQDEYPGASVVHSELPRDPRVIELVKRFFD